MASSYSGTITQGVGATISLNGSYSWNQAGGIFVGSNSNITLNATFGAQFTITGGTFTSTSGTLNMSAYGTYVTFGPGATFNHNNGTVNVGSDTLNIGTRTFNILTLSNANNLTITGALTVLGTLKLNSANQNRLFGGSILALGNVVTGGTGGYGGSPSTTLTIGGSTSQSIDTSATPLYGFLPNLVIDSTGGTVSFIGTMRLTQGYTYTSGTIAAGTSNLYFTGNSVTQAASMGTPTYYDITVSPGGCSGLTVNFQGSVTMSNNFNETGGCATIVNMPNPGAAYTLGVTGAATVVSGSTLNLHGATFSKGSLSNTGTINP